MRYVDDIFCIVKKGTKKTLLEKLNKFDKNLKFTMNSMENSKIIFLDTSVVQNGDSLHLEQFRKSNSSDCMVNFKNSITPKGYKISALVGELYRANNTTTTTEALDSALQTTKEIFIKNKFPPRLIDQKINHLKLKNFQPSDSKERRRLEFENPDFDHHTISLPFSSYRCSQVASQIYNIIKRYTPYYKLNIVFTTIKLESIILPRLKPKKQFNQNSNCIYEFICVCDSNYIGETCQLLHSRIKQHKGQSESHINQHILTCVDYQNTFMEKYQVDPDNLPSTYTMHKYRREFLEEHFEILETNLINTNHRKIFEGLLITLRNPVLNKQVAHACMTFLCTCLIPKSGVKPNNSIT